MRGKEREIYAKLKKIEGEKERKKKKRKKGKKERNIERYIDNWKNRSWKDRRRCTYRERKNKRKREIYNKYDKYNNIHFPKLLAYFTQ